MTSEENHRHKHLSARMPFLCDLVSHLSCPSALHMDYLPISRQAKPKPNEELRFSLFKKKQIHQGEHCQCLTINHMGFTCDGRQLLSCLLRHGKSSIHHQPVRGASRETLCCCMISPFHSKHVTLFSPY